MYHLINGHVTYVLNNRTVDVHINGKLERSCVLKDYQ